VVGLRQAKFTFCPEVIIIYFVKWMMTAAHLHCFERINSYIRYDAASLH
jgi:hypothetical protein